jgi:hypothetical protein
LYAVAQRLLPALAISNESVTYYASLVSYYSVYKLRRMKTGPMALYLLCFVSYRYQRVHDHLFNSLLHHVRRYTDEAKSVPTRARTKPGASSGSMTTFRSLYLLEYLDSPPLRQHVQRALNRGENYHQLRRAVAYANLGKLRFRTEHDQQLWGECSRLLTNDIIYYNATILSNLLAYKEAQGDTESVALLARVSPVAWQYINWYGRYEFRKQLEAINMNAILQVLIHLPVPHDLAG